MLKFLLVMVAILLLSPFLLGLLLRLSLLLLRRRFPQSHTQEQPIQFGNLTILKPKGAAKRKSTPDEGEEGYADFEEIK
ncbi:hypothetical protein [Hugenholtzia roseola]|uniref:hypothetical protein n=1 Tax=Hugenholtzia roseola TaxID=1002 RepID=UPI00041E6236|nr:hypothetical protein [Hugenholtzia roseola]